MIHVSCESTEHRTLSKRFDCAILVRKQWVFSKYLFPRISVIAASVHNIMSDIRPLKLEALPDEIFLEVFKYVDPVDLHSFSELNHRLHRIVRDVKVNVVIHWQEEEELACLASLIPTQIICLEMRDYWLSFDLMKMVELRSLTIDCTYLSSQQLNQVRLFYLTKIHFILFRYLRWLYPSLSVYPSTMSRTIFANRY
jgi:hypothetical protein